MGAACTCSFSNSVVGCEYRYNRRNRVSVGSNGNGLA